MAVYCLGALAITGSCLAATPPYAAESANQSAHIYPQTDEIFSPRIYGKASAGTNVILMISPANHQDEELWVNLYPQLQPLVAAGKIKLEIKLWGHMQLGLPIYLVAQCLDPSTMPLYLYEMFGKGMNARFTAPTDLEEYALEQALQDPQLRTPGLTEDEFHRRLAWCLSKRNEGMIYSEDSRFNNIYDWKLKDSGVLAPAVVVNQTVFDGTAVAESVMDEIREATQ